MWCVTIAVEGMRWIQTCVLVGCPVGLTPLLGIKHIILLGDGIQRGGIVQVHGHLVTLALLGGNDNHTVSGAATVDRG